MAAPKTRSPFAKIVASLSDVTFRPRYAVAMPQCDLRTRVLGADLAFPAILGARRLQPADASRRRTGCGLRSGIRRSHLHALDDLRSQTRECSRRFHGTCLVSTLYCRRPRRRRSRHRARATRWLFRARRHHRYARRGPARARSAKWNERTPRGLDSFQAAISAADVRAPGMARFLSARWRGSATREHRHSRTRAPCH